MKGTARIFCLYVFMAMLMLNQMPSEAQDLRSAGTFNSLKGAGMTLTWNAGPRSYAKLDVTADFSGMMSSFQTTPGLLAEYSNIVVLGRGEYNEEPFSFYLGPGLALGYVHDRNHGYGPMGGVHLLCGAEMLFRKHIGISLEMDAVLGMHIFNDSDSRRFVTSTYRDGYFRTWMPSIIISYLF